MIGGAVAAWPWEEPRPTQDVEIVIHLSPESINQLSNEFEQIEISIPPALIRDNLLDTRADLPINAIHSPNGFKAKIFTIKEGDKLRLSAFNRRKKVNLGLRSGMCLYTHPKI